MNKIFFILLLSPLFCLGQYRVDYFNSNPSVSDDSKYGHMGHWGTSEETINPISVNVLYGYLYNWYVTSDSRNIANSGWRVPTYADFVTLDGYVLSLSLGRSTRTSPDPAPRWDSPNTLAENKYGLNILPSGVRNWWDGSFWGMTIETDMWTSTSTGDNTAWYSYWDTWSTGTYLVSTNKKNNGCCIRLIKESTTLSHGETGWYIGNDLKRYPTICVGTQEWMSVHLCETKYRNGNSIPEETDGTTFIGLTTGARCSYGNNEANAFE